MWNFEYAFEIAVFVFPILAMILTIPFLIYQYNRYGSLHMWRSVTIFAFIFYMLVAYFVVILPLPSRSSVAQMTSAYTQYELFDFMNIFRNVGSWGSLLRSTAFQQVFFNILLTVPFGVFLRYYFKKSWIVTVLFTFGLSLFYELTQLSGLYGIYVRPYRIFDVDDLFLNTLGGIIGYALTPLIVFLFPSRDKMDDDSYGKAADISIFRRVLAFLTDTAVWLGVALIAVNFIFPEARIKAHLQSVRLLMNAFSQRPELFGILVVFGAVWFMLIPWFSNGYTIGKRLVGLRLSTHDQTRIRLGKLMVRYGYLALVLLIAYAAFLLFMRGQSLSAYNLDGVLLSMYIVLFVAALHAYDFIASLVDHRPFIYERLSGISNRNIVNNDADETSV